MLVLCNILTLTGCNCCCYFPPLIPPRLIPFQIESDCPITYSRHTDGAHLEHRRITMGRLHCAREEEILLRPHHCARPRSYGCNSTFYRPGLAKGPRTHPQDSPRVRLLL